MRFEEGRFYLLVIKSGFVLVGRFEQSPDALFLRVVGKAAKVRWWGTTAGLGELAEKGPLDATKLDVEATEYDYRFRESAPVTGIPFLPTIGIRGQW